MLGLTRLDKEGLTADFITQDQLRPEGDYYSLEGQSDEATQMFREG